MKNNEKKIKKGTLTVIIMAVLMTAAVALVLLRNSGVDLQIEKSGQTVELAYGFKIQLSEAYSDIVEHTQEKHEDRITEVFVLKNDKVDMSLFCINFGDRESGDWLGQLNIDGIGVPVTYILFSPEAEELQKLDEKGLAAYDAMRTSFSDLLNTIVTDSRFVMEEEQDDLVMGQQREMTYWSVALPEVITFEEISEDDFYQANFFGEVKNEQIMLYSVRIGDDSLFSELGLFEIDGVKRVVSVETYSLKEQDDWEQSEFERAYRMMDTINDVIHQIMASEHYSESSAE